MNAQIQLTARHFKNRPWSSIVINGASDKAFIKTTSLLRGTLHVFLSCKEAAPPAAGVHLFLGHVKLILIKSIEYEVLTSDEM